MGGGASKAAKAPRPGEGGILKNGSREEFMEVVWVEDLR